MKDIEGVKGKERLEVEIGPAKPSDAKEIAELLYAGWKETYVNELHNVTAETIDDYWKPEVSDEEAITARAKRIEELAGNVVMLTARSEGKLVGLVRIVKRDTENYVGAFYVLPEMHRNGVGQALWNRTQKMIGKDKPTILDVISYNEGAQKFYESLGFEDTGGPVFFDPRLRLPNGAIPPQRKMRRPAEVQSYV